MLAVTPRALRPATTCAAGSDGGWLERQDARASLRGRRAQADQPAFDEAALEPIQVQRDPLPDPLHSEGQDRVERRAERRQRQTSRRAAFQEIDAGLERPVIAELAGTTDQKADRVVVTEPAGGARHQRPCVARVHEAGALEPHQPFVRAAREVVDTQGVHVERHDAARLDGVHRELGAIAATQLADPGDRHAQAGLKLHRAHRYQPHALPQRAFQSSEHRFDVAHRAGERHELELEAEELGRALPGRQLAGNSPWNSTTRSPDFQGMHRASSNRPRVVPGTKAT